MSEPEEPVTPRDDYIVEQAAKEFAEEKAAVLAELTSPEAKELTASGWWTVRHMVVGVGLTALLFGGVAWTHWLVNTPEYQENYGLGRAASYSRVGIPKPPAH